MSYTPKGMHAAQTGQKSAVKDKLPTVRTILPKGRRQRTRFMDAWDMVKLPKAVAMPASSESPTMPRISRKLRVSYVTRIAEKWLHAPKPRTKV